MTLLSGAKNVAADLQGPILTLTIDLSNTATAAASKSGKTLTIASSSGSKPIGGTGAALSFSASMKGTEVKLPADPKAAEAPQGMKNVTVQYEGSILKLAMDLTADFGKSASGHTRIIASSSGMKTLPGTNLLINLNVFAKGEVDLAATASAAPAPSAGQVLQGVEVEVSGTVCSLSIDTTKEIGPSKAGKAIILATSNGFATIPGTDLSCDLMVCKTLKAKDPSIGELAEQDLPGGKKLKCCVQGATLVLKFDSAEIVGTSGTGKSSIVATSGGMRAIPGTPLSINFSAYKGKEAAKRKGADALDTAPTKKAKVATEVGAEEKEKEEVTEQGGDE